MAFLTWTIKIKHYIDDLNFQNYQNLVQKMFLLLKYQNLLTFSIESPKKKLSRLSRCFHMESPLAPPLFPLFVELLPGFFFYRILSELKFLKVLRLWSSSQILLEQWPSQGKTCSSSSLESGWPPLPHSKAASGYYCGKQTFFKVRPKRPNRPDFCRYESHSIVRWIPR